MGNPTEMLATRQMKTSLLKWCCVFLERRQVTLFLPRFLRTNPVLQGAAKRREPVVHVDHDANSSGCEQTEDVSRAIELLSGAMAVADCVYADDEVKGVLPARTLSAQAR